MRLVFMGTPEFASVSLKRLYDDGYDIAAVFTQPDKPQNRGMILSYSPVKELAVERGTPVYQPATLKNNDVARIIRELGCDLITVVAYGRLLPPDILEIPPLGCINIHSSLLPAYRGAAPVQWAIINGEKETGVSSMYMAPAMDAGDVIFTQKTQIGDDETAGELLERLAPIGAELLSMTVTAVAAGNAVGKPQDYCKATFAPTLSKEISPINWTETAHSIKCKVRGLNPWPVATAEFGGVVFKVFTVKTRVITDSVISRGVITGGAITGGVTRTPCDSAVKPGTILSAGQHGIEVACADGAVIIEDIQAPGGKRMKAADYLRGHKI